MNEMDYLIIIGDLEVQNRRLKFEIEQLQNQVQRLSKESPQSETKLSEFEVKHENKNNQ